MDILPISPSGLFSLVEVPHLEGCARLTLAWQGVDFSLEPKTLSWGDRALCWLQGTLLMIPLINTVVWLAWKTFGHPTSWTDPFCPEENIPPLPIQLPATTAPHQACYLNPEGKLFTQKISSFPHCKMVEEHSEEFSTAARYHNQALQEWVCHRKDLSIHVCNTSNGLQLQTDPPLPLRYSSAPWIQQPAMGLKNWILSDQTTLEFDTVLYEYPPHLSLCFLPWVHFDTPPLLLAMCATKGEVLTTPEGRRLMKVEIAPQTHWLLQVLCKSEWWFDANTGEMYQFSNAGLFMHPESGRVVQNGPSPGSARP